MVLVAVKLGILPVPMASKPIAVFVLVQSYTIVPPVVGLLNTTAAVGAPLQTVWLATGFTTGTGLTVIVNVLDGPVQLTPPLVNTGVTTIVPTLGALVAFCPLKLGISPTPAAASPIVVLLFVQLNTSVPPVDALVNTTGAVGAPVHTVWFAGWFTCGVGFTVIVKLIGVPGQLTPPLV